MRMAIRVAFQKGANIGLHPGEEKKFIVGRMLTFRQYEDEPAGPFIPGDQLRTLPENGCGMGIDVVRVSDGRKDMVWPDEVTL